MRQALFRGIPFWVNTNSGENGRQTAIHTYPMKDEVWVEDLGRSQRRYHIRGFVIGDQSVALGKLMTSAVEQSGPGLLIHPTLGMLRVSVTNFSWQEPDNINNRIDFNFDFTEYSNPVAGLLSEFTGSVVSSLSDSLSDSAVSDFLTDSTKSFNLGMLNTATSVASSWGQQALLQGTGTIPIAALGSVTTTAMGSSLLNLAVSRDNLTNAVKGIDPNFDTNGAYSYVVSN